MKPAWSSLAGKTLRLLRISSVSVCSITAPTSNTHAGVGIATLAPTAFGRTRWQDEDREIRPGDRVLQKANCIIFNLWAMVEVFAAERSDLRCSLGYVTTSRHFGRGSWQATLTREEKEIVIEIAATTTPGSWLFWAGMPVARYLQKRAWRRAIEEFLRC